MNSYLLYLVQVSTCHAIFYLLYRIAYQKSTWFLLNRFYLLLSTLAGFCIPLLEIEVWDPASSYAAFSFSSSDGTSASNYLATGLTGQPEPGLSLASLFDLFYLTGTVIVAIRFLAGIFKTIKLITNNPKQAQRGYTLITIEKGPAFFSFFRYIFLNRNRCTLKERDFNIVLSHELVHVAKGHTYDLLFMEIVKIVCWFSPFSYLIKRSLVQVHEFQADEIASGDSELKKDYVNLILDLSGKRSFSPFIHQFSFLLVKKRIYMLYNQNNRKMKKSFYLLTLPLIAILMAMFSFTEKASKKDLPKTADSRHSITIHSIRWEGNDLYSDALLSKVLGVQVGDLYDKEAIEQKLAYSQQRDDIGSLYMDNGYLFFNIAYSANIDDDKVDLAFVVNEGDPVKIRNIIIEGNKKVQASKIREMISLASGDLFSRSKLIDSQKSLSQSALFDREILIEPIPLQGQQLCDIRFVVKEI